MNEAPANPAGTPAQTDPAAGPPQLSAEQFARLAAYGVAQEVRSRDIVFRPGDQSYDLIIIEAGRIEIVSPATHDEPEAVVAHGPGGFLGELNLLTGQTAYLTARVTQAGRIHRIAPERFRRLMADDPEISDVLLRTFLARRDLLRDSPAARGIEIVGNRISAEALALRTYAARQRLLHLWLDADSVAGRALMRSMPWPRQIFPPSSHPIGCCAAPAPRGWPTHSACPTDAAPTSRLTSPSSAPARPGSPRLSTVRPRAWTRYCSMPSAWADKRLQARASRTTSAFPMASAATTSPNGPRCKR